MRPAHKPGPAVTRRDAEEEAAIQAAASELLKWAPSTGDKAELIAHAVVSAWIISRVTSTMTQRRMFDLVTFDLKPAKLRGIVSAALPKLAEALAKLPADRPLFELSKDEVTDVFVAGALAVQAAEFDDEIPF